MQKVNYCIGVNIIGQPIYITHFLENTKTTFNYVCGKAQRTEDEIRYAKRQK